MTDRELLQKAAKAANFTPPKAPPIHSDGWMIFREWDPLLDDGDRYRLARDCGLRIDFQLQRVLNMNGRIFDWTTNGTGDDEAHAIVRAAAEMADAPGAA